MFYEAELRILRDTFRKCHIPTAIAELSKPICEHPDFQSHLMLNTAIDPEKPLAEYLPSVQPATIYRLTTSLNNHYTYMLLPEVPRDALLIIGPYLTAAPTGQQLLEWAEKKHLSPADLKYMEGYYNDIPILPEASHLFGLLDAFGGRLWGINGISVEDVEQDTILPAEVPKSLSVDDMQLRAKNIERTYRYENEMMDAVSKGHIHKVELLLSNLSVSSFEQRVADPVRNAKNYSIIMNTLLRKAAEQGGVHPMYLDRTSSDYAVRIEQVHTLEAIPQLISEMFRGYCRLVRKHSMQDYSPPVQKAILFIDANLADNLSLRTLAEALNVSSSYLSSLFRKETGVTLTDHINQRRIRHAMHLLKTTRLQIQTIAQHCGIVDVQYFSKVFKRIAGMSPKQYRNASAH